jgi:2-polyprenyl-3-methyl-5-hydroxy-6-metoxy-1,4-benzoquinol methylase
MSLNRYIVKFAPGLLRVYRTKFLLDLEELLGHLPEKGKILDVGCAIGSTDYVIGELRPNLNIIGIDIDPKVVDQANRRNTRSNVRYLARPLEEMDGEYDCVAFVDLLHHVEDNDARRLMVECIRLLKPVGYLFVKEIDRRGGYFSYFMDRFVAMAKPVRLRTPDEIKGLIPAGLSLEREKRKWRFPQPHVYLKLKPVAAKAEIS